MSASQTQTKSAIASSVTSLGVSLTGVVSGNHLNVTTYSSNGTTSSPTSTPAVTWTSAVSQAVKFPLFDHSYRENVASGSWTVNGNVTAASTIGVCVSESSGVATSASLGATNENTAGAAATIQPGSITPAAGSVLYAGTGTTVPTGGTDAATIDTGFTVAEIGGGMTVWDIGTFNMGGGTAYLGNAPSVATNPTWTSGVNWTGTKQLAVAFIVEYKAAGGGSSTPPPLIVPMRSLLGVGR